jgi:carbon-monoxide dehydrogenase small subunit
MSISFKINGKLLECEVLAGESLLELLRDRLELTGTKKGCGVGECGACTVLVDGIPVDSCIYLAEWVDQKDVQTIEGVEDQKGTLSKVQDAFIDEGAVQCGFCIPGFVMSATAMANKEKKFSRDEIRRELSGNFCRCTGYNNITNAVDKVVGEKEKK